MIRAAISLISLMLLAACTDSREISQGAYGPFQIGESKQQTAEKVQSIVPLGYVEPVTLRNIYIRNPTSESIHELDTSEGITVALRDGSALRIEFTDDVVVKTWGNDTCAMFIPVMSLECTELQQLENQIRTGMHRDEVYEVILGFETQLSKQVGNFVIGVQEYRIGKISTDDYVNVLMKNNVWQFEGLKDLSRYDDPYYSKITLFFENDRLSRITHESFPFELP